MGYYPRYYRLCSSGSLLQSALIDPRKLSQSGNPQGIINHHIIDVLNKNRHQRNNPVSTVPKKNIVILLPYLGLQSNQVAKRLKSCVHKFYSYVNLEIIFQSTRCIKSLIPYKEGINPFTPGTFCQKCIFLDILVFLRLDLGQISFSPVENAFATRQLALAATRIAFYDILARACVEIQILGE